jgi:hypothetical protein
VEVSQAGRLAARRGKHQLDIWAEPLAVASPLPTLPLWLAADLALPLHLEETYRAACAARRIELP